MTPYRTLTLWPATLLAAMVLTLSACGGGDSPSTPVPIVPGAANAGQLKDATPVNTVTLADLTAAVGAAGSKLPGAVPRYAVTSWRLTYVTSDGFGREVIASGLVSVPVKPDGARSPVLSYQHATIYKDAQAPSNLVVATEPPVVLASLGFIVVAADYVGYGASRGSQHPYLLSTPTAAVVMDLLTAARTWRQTRSLLTTASCSCSATRKAATPPWPRTAPCRPRPALIWRSWWPRSRCRAVPRGCHAGRPAATGARRKRGPRGPRQPGPAQRAKHTGAQRGAPPDPAAGDSG
ncbi:MAG: hypothetical protein IPI16_02315 [Comamonadaceae bacterium]|nr:hypothetical protein [Comamonadaceae bacterium]